MNPLIETGVIVAAAVLAAAFVVLRILKIIRGKRPPCCSGEGKPAKYR